MNPEIKVEIYNQVLQSIQFDRIGIVVEVDSKKYLVRKINNKIEISDDPKDYSVYDYENKNWRQLKAGSRILYRKNHQLEDSK